MSRSSVKYAIAFGLIILATPTRAAELVVSNGVFHGGDHAPRDTTSGEVAVVRLENGKYEIRLGSHFNTTPGPDLFVYLSASTDPQNSPAVVKDIFANLGKLTSSTGAQRISISKHVHLKEYNSVVIWCKQYSILFGAAPLQQ